MNEQEINRYWKKIVNTMSEGFMLVGPDGTIIMVNEAFERLTGYTSKEVIGRPCTILNCDACEMNLKGSGKAWCRLFVEGQVLKCRCHLMIKDGSYVPALKNAAVLKDEKGVALGAVEILTDLSELERLDQKVGLLSRQLEEDVGFHGMLGKSNPMQKLFDVVQKAANSEAPVIIYGESGTGKELVARAIHQLGRRKNEPFVQFNCAALNEALLESELFGHIKGAFTGAYRHRQGRFEAANRGDIFLDEIGDVPLSVQVKLLRVLETKQFEHVGDHHPISVDVRIITATNKNLEELIAQKKFRDDLFFRINVFPIHLPPLRERSEDIPLLVNTFVRRLRLRTGKKINGLSSAAMDCFMNYRWPGNVRELKSALEYAFVIAEKGLIDRDQLPSNIVEPKPPIPESIRPPLQANSFLEVDEFMISEPNSDEPGEKTALIKALQQCKGNQSQTARVLGINRVTVWNRMKKYGIDLKRVLSI
ncbi:MAG: sigma 54-interacting transcriptional regulator [Deltaproteobacteria bacterium]|nr:sigma 54-interacting transcriptional regulator [Deltaproteobacteria bacterium]